MVAEAARLRRLQTAAEEDSARLQHELKKLQDNLAQAATARDDEARGRLEVAKALEGLQQRYGEMQAAGNEEQARLQRELATTQHELVDATAARDAAERRRHELEAAHADELARLRKQLSTTQAELDHATGACDAAERRRHEHETGMADDLAQLRHALSKAEGDVEMAVRECKRLENKCHEIERAGEEALARAQAEARTTRIKLEEVEKAVLEERREKLLFEEQASLIRASLSSATAEHAESSATEHAERESREARLEADRDRFRDEALRSSLEIQKQQRETAELRTAVDKYERKLVLASYQTKDQSQLMSEINKMETSAVSRL